MNKPINPIKLTNIQSCIPIGIDFGTSNSVMSGYKQSTLVTGPTSFNFPLTSSFLYPSIALLDHDNGVIRTGAAAYNRRITDPQNVVVSVKRRITSADKYILSNKEYTNVDIVESIISDFSKEVKLTDHEFSPGVITVTVPYYFGENENAFILKTAQNALKSQLNYNAEIFLLPEPIAASLACIYQLHESSIDSKVFLIYDIGGGTLDLTLVRITNNNSTFEYEVLANDGICNFGGDDIDELLLDYVIYHEGIENLNLDDRHLLLNKARLIEECKEAKHNLSINEHYSFMCSNLFGVDGGYIELEITRDNLNSILSGQLGSKRNMIEEFSECLNQIYSKARINKESVNFIVPVGGTSFIPAFRDLVTNIHPNAKELTTSNMMDNFTIVANGASIFSAMKSDEIYNTKYHPFKQGNAIEKMKTRVSHALYLEKFNGKLDVLIEANALSPAISHKIYYPTKLSNSGDIVDIGTVQLYQGEGNSRKNRKYIGNIDFSEYIIYSHGRKLNDIPIYIDIEATETLVTVHCKIPNGDIRGNDIEFSQIIHN